MNNSEVILKRIWTLLGVIYPEFSTDKKAVLLEKIEHIISEAKQRRSGKSFPFLQGTEKDIVLICYGDSFSAEKQEKYKLRDVHTVFDQYLSDLFSVVHILPFYPYSSDDGFSVMHYKEVRKDLGNWEHINTLATKTCVMVDFVSNHCSIQHPWFQKFLADEEGYTDFFLEEKNIPMNESEVLQVVRPRTSPLFHGYSSSVGEKRVWTTFSQDQVDINYRSSEVFFRMIQVLCEYLSHGVNTIRIDAVPFLWKKKGTRCSHLPETHALVQIFKAVCDLVDPCIKVITESNVPYVENISYFGVQTKEDGTEHIPFPEADLVYNFSLSPLLLHTLMSQNSEVFSTWLIENRIPEQRYFFNFLASHDGIGMRGAEGYLSSTDLKNLEFIAKKNKGKVSYKTDSKGGKKVYELNCTWASILHTQDMSDEMNIQKLLLSYAVLLGIKGVPALYYSSLLGQKNQYDEVVEEDTSTYRRINRMPISSTGFHEEEGFKEVFLPFSRLISLRKSQKAFSPSALQTVFVGNHSVLAFERKSVCETDSHRILAIYNISHHPVSFYIPHGWQQEKVYDVISGKQFSFVEEKNHVLNLEPYEFLWIKEGITEE